MLTPVASLVTFFAVSVIGNLAAKIIVFLGPKTGWSENFFQYLVIPAVSAFFAVRVVGYLAPKAKRTAAILVAGAWVTFAGVITFFAILTQTWTQLLFITSFLSGIGYAILTIEEIQSQEEGLL